MAGTPLLASDGIFSLITATQAASYCGVALCTITKWVRIGNLEPAGIDERGRKLYRVIDVAKAEKATRDRARRVA